MQPCLLVNLWKINLKNISLLDLFRTFLASLFLEAQLAQPELSMRPEVHEPGLEPGPDPSLEPGPEAGPKPGLKPRYKSGPEPGL